MMIGRGFRRRICAVGLSLALTITGSGAVQAANLHNDSSQTGGSVVQPEHKSSSREGAVGSVRGVPETDPRYMNRGGYIPVEQDRDVPVIIDDGDYEGIDIEEKAYEEAYSSVDLESIEQQDLEEQEGSEEEETISHPAMGASSSDKTLNNMENMPPVRDQGDYETCWAFSTLAAVEGDLIADGLDTSDIDLSELHLAYYTEHFNTSVKSDPMGGTNGDSVVFKPRYENENYLNCGGNTLYALKALMAWAGAVDETKQPYSSAESTLSVPDSRGLTTGQYASDVHVNGYYAYNMSSAGDRLLVKDAIVKHGALAASMWAVSSFYDKETNTFYDPYSTDTNHAVSIVGWDDSVPEEYFEREYEGITYTPPGPGAWLVRNSWGNDGYDYDGYFWLSYYNKANYDPDAVGIAAYAVDATLPDEDYDNNYTYDGQIGCDQGWGYPGSFSAVNIFTAKSNEVLGAIAFEAYSARVDYTVDIYTDVHPIYYNSTNGHPNLENALHVDRLSGTTNARGYYNLKLNSPVLLTPGQTFAVQVTLNNGDDKKDVFIGGECAGGGAAWLKQTTSAPLGEGFRYTNGWGVSHHENGARDSYCIKAYTDNRSSAGLTSVNITGQSSGNVLKIGGDYVLTAQGNNNSLISSVAWSSSNPNVIDVRERTRHSSLLDVKKEGSAQITARVRGLDNSGKPVEFIKTLSFTVSGIAVQKVTVTDPSGSKNGKGELGKPITLTAGITPGSEEKNMVWTASDSSVVSLAPSGDKMSCTITPKALGNTVITATSSTGKKGTYKLSIIKPIRSVTVRWGNNTEQSGINISSLGNYTYYGLEAQLNSDATDKDLVWSSDNPSVISIDDYYIEDGVPRCTIKVYPVAGRTTVTARSPYSGVSGRYTFITYKNPVTAVNIKDVNSGRIEKGKSITLSAEYTPRNADYGTEMEWSINDTRRLSMKENSDGTCTVTGLAQGSAYVRATSKNTNKYYDYRVTVWVPVNSIQILDYDNNTECALKSGAVRYLIGYLNTDVEQGQDLTVSWTSSDENVATVNKTSDDTSYFSYATVTAHNPGTAVITGRTANGLTASYRVTVVESSVTGVSLDKTSLSLEKGKTETLTASVKPAGAAVKIVNWSSSDDDVASVSTEGKVTAKSKGTAIITVTTLDGGYTDSCTVTVVESNDVYITDETGASSGKSEAGKPLILTAKSFSSGNINISSWTTTSSSVAELRVSTDRKTCEVVPKAAGSATIKVQTSDGKSGEYALNVIRPITSINVKHGSWEDEYPDRISSEISWTYEVTAELNSSATDKDIVWTSDNPSIISIKESTVEGGVPKCRIEVQPIAGRTTIKAVSPYSGVSDTLVFITYRNPVTAVNINDVDSGKIELGKSITLSAGYTPEDADFGTEMEWSINDTGRLSMKENPDGTCTVTGLDTGSAYVRATSKFTNYCYDYRVTVWAPVYSIEVKDDEGHTEGTLDKGEEKSLTGYLNTDVDESQDTTVTWTSSNENVVKVIKDYDDLYYTYASLEGVSSGKAVITATTANGLSATYDVTVISKVSGVKLNKSETKLRPGAGQMLAAMISPLDASDKTLSWSSSDSNVATVDTQGLVTAVDSGEAWITVKTNDGGYTARCKVIVEIPTVSLTLDQTELSLEKGDTATLKAEILPVNATDKEISWESSNSGVATVNNGAVKAVGSGNAKITAKTKSGFSAVCDVTVTTRVTGITLNKTDLSLEEGETETLSATIYPADATDRGIIWSSSDSSVATVSKTGEVAAISEGEADITAETSDGGFSVSCSVKVTKSEDKHRALVDIGVIGTDDTIIYGTTPSPNVYVTVNGSPVSGTPTEKIVDENGMVITDKYPGAGVYKYMVSYNTEEGYGTAERMFTVAKGTLTADMIYVSPDYVKIGDREPRVLLTDPDLRFGANAALETKYVLEDGAPQAFSDIEEAGTYNVRLWIKGDGNFYDPNGIELSQTVTVISDKPDPVPVQSVNVSPLTAALDLGENNTMQFIAKVEPEEATDQSIAWSQSSEDGGEVWFPDPSENPLTVTAVKAGTVYLTATTTDGGLTDTAMISISEEAIIKTSAPAFSPVPGTYTLPQDVRISSETEGAVIYYTTDGSTPGSQSEVYSEPLHVDRSMTIKAFAVRDGMDMSDVVSAEYKIEKEKTATPAFDPASGTYTGTQSVSISTETEGATVYYTTDGSAPSDTSPIYTGPVTVDRTMTIKAIAVKEGMENSDIATAQYTINEKAVLVTEVKVSPAAVTLIEGETAKLTATVLPEDATDKTVTWRSGDERIATVTSDGVIRGISKGSVVITAAAAGGIKDSVTVTVNKPDPVTEKIINETDDKTRIEIAEDLNGETISSLIGENSADDSKVVITRNGEIAETRIWVGGISSVYTFTGNAIKPEPHVYDGTTKLVKDTDYTVSYQNNTRAGLASLKITFKGNYMKDPRTVPFTIEKADLSEDVLITAAAIEAGKATKPSLSFTMKSGGKTFGAGKFSFPADKITLAAGESKDITVTAKDPNFKGEAKVTIEAAAKANLLSKASFKFSPAKFTYTGEEIEPDDSAYVVKIGSTTLARGEDYDVKEIINNKEPGKATVVIEGKGAYKGEKSATFTILKGQQIDAGDMTVTINNGKDVYYAKGKVSPLLSVRLKDGTELVHKNDYTYSFKNNKAAGTASVTVKLKGRYKGSKTAEFEIRKQNLSNLRVVVEDKVKGSSADFYKKPKVTITDLNGSTLKNKSDYVIGTDYAYDAEAGKVTVSCKGNGSYTADDGFRLEYRVISADKNIGKAKAGKLPDQIYTGRAIVLSDDALQGRLTLGKSGSALKPGVDFTIDEKSYVNNVKKGTASFAVRGAGEYGGVKILKFKIVQKKVNWNGAYKDGKFIKQ